jgi:hypothetical protein
MSDAARPTRFDRLSAILKVLLVQEKFTLAEMKERLPRETPGYVTRLVRNADVTDSAGRVSECSSLTEQDRVRNSPDGVGQFCALGSANAAGSLARASNLPDTWRENSRPCFAVKSLAN